MTKFEEDLKVYFPDIYKLHLLGKDDKKIWILVSELILMAQSKEYGKIELILQDGFINKIYVTKTR